MLLEMSNIYDAENMGYGNNAGNLFEPWFGPGNGHHDEVRADERLSHETFNMPKHYVGKSQHLEDVLDFMIRKEDEFYTSRLLPWSYTDQIHVAWEEFRFNRTLMDVEPEQGIPRLVTAETQRHTDNLIRRGIAFQLEHGFMTTESGRRHFMMNLQQITDAVHTTAYFGVMHALLTGKNHYKEWARTYDRKAKRPRNMMRGERDRWAIVQKSHKGLYLLDADLKHQMKINGVTPNTWVFPPKMSIYLDMMPREETEFQLKGPKAAGNLEEDRSQTGYSWRGTKVFEAQSFDVDFTNNAFDMLARDRMIGEYFTMPHGTNKIQIFSADHDSYQTISRADAESCAFNQHSSEQLDHLYRFRADITRDHHSGNLKQFAKKVSGAIDKFFAEKHRKYAGLKKEFSRKMHVDGKPTLQETLMRAEKDAFKARYIETLSALYEQWKAADAAARRGFNIDRFITNFNDATGATEITDVNAGTFGLVPGRDGVETRAKVKKLLECLLKPGAFETRTKEVQTLINAIDAQIIAQNVSTKATTLPATGDILTLIEGLCVFELQIWEVVRAQDELKALVVEFKPSRDLILFRPFQTYRMSSAILAAGGKELGETFHGHHDFQLSDDVIRKVHVGHYTHSSKSVVKRPKRYAIAEDVFAQGYVSGEGIRFFTEDSYRDANGSAKIGSSEMHDSLIAWAVPAGSTAGLSEAIDMSGSFSGEYFSDYNDDGEHFVGSGALSSILGVEEMGGDSDQFLSDVQHINTVCFRGSQKEWDGAAWGKATKNKGHWGDITYDGAMAVREGTKMHCEK